MRWLQWACFVGVFRTHGSHEKRIWLYSTYEQLADAMRLRGAMMPWLYTLAYRVHTLSEPFLRPMWFEHPELNPHGVRGAATPGGQVKCGAGTGNHTHVGHDVSGSSQRSPTHPVGLLVKNLTECCGACASDPLCTAYIFADTGAVRGSGCDSCNCWPMAEVTGLEPRSGRTVGGDIGPGAAAYKLGGQFYFDDAIVRPITWGVGADNTTQATTWLPPGSWSRWDGGSQHTVPPHAAQNVTETFRLGEIPVYVPTGKLFPLATLESTGAMFSDPLIWVAVAPTGAAAVREDDGETEAYAAADATTSAQAWTNATYSANRTAVVLRVGGTVGGAAIGLPSTRSHWFQIRGKAAGGVTGMSCNGASLTGPAAIAAPGSWWRCRVDDTNDGVPSSLACPDGAVVGACPAQPSAEAVTVDVTMG